MQSSRMREASKVCLHDCCPCSLLCLPESSQNRLPRSRSTSAACRQEFATITTSSIFPNSQFTNHESLPSLQACFNEFTKAYPQYFETDKVDQIRAQEYYHLSLSNHTCLDYIGIGLFSHSQKQKHYATIPIVSSSASSLLSPQSPPQNLDFTRFSISYRAGYLTTHLLHGGQESELESAMKRKIMSFLNISENDYSMVFTANKVSAFKLLAEAYPFQSSRKLLTVYDYESEAVDTMITSSEKKGARVMSAEFSWPRLRIHSKKLKKLIMRKRKKKKKKGLFVFPLHSRITGTRNPYLWMSIAQENGWHVLLDACALGPKDMDSFGFSLFQPDFLVCSFYKVFGENPSGFGCLFVKKSTIPVLESSRSSGIISIVPEKLSWLPDESSATATELEQISQFEVQEAELAPPSSFLRPISEKSVQGETSEFKETEGIAKQEGPETTGIVQSEKPVDLIEKENSQLSKDGSFEIVCRGLDQVDSLGHLLISNRARYLVNWLVTVLMRLQHPNTKGIHLVRIYGPKVKFDRGPALAFNVFDWKGEKVDPVLVQKLADRSNISLSYGFLNHIWFSDKYGEEKALILEKKSSGANGNKTNKRKEDKSDQGIKVVTAALGFLANFEDVYRLWAFVAQFLDADFVEKERWRYTALNQKTIEV